jgi:hypothetical protein
MGFMDIFSTSSIDTAVNAIVSTGDALVFTEEEKKELNKKVIEFKFETLTKNGNFQLAQRYLAVLFAVNFFAAFWVGVFIYFFNESKLDGYMQLVAVFNLGWIAMAIFSFYYSGGFIKSFKSK